MWRWPQPFPCPRAVLAWSSKVAPPCRICSLKGGMFEPDGKDTSQWELVLSWLPKNDLAMHEHLTSLFSAPNNNLKWYRLPSWPSVCAPFPSVAADVWTGGLQSAKGQWD
jgi:hypothetical protein